MPSQDLAPHLPARPIDRLEILGAALLFSTGGAAIKACSLSSWQVAAFRSGIAACALALLLSSARARWNARVLGVACAYAATLVLFVTANKLTTAANSIFLQDTAPLYILLLGPLLLREPIRRRDLAFMAALVAGMGLFFVGRQPVSATAPDPMTGNLIALLSGTTWALTVVGLRSLGRDRERDGDSTAAVCAGNVVACAVCLPMAFPVGRTSLQDWLAIVFLGVFQIALAYVLLTRGVRRVGALEASLLLILEPVLSPIWAWLVHRERPSSWALLGGAIILLATVVYTLSNEPRPRAPASAT